MHIISFKLIFVSSEFNNSTHHIKSLQCEQNVGCLKKRGIKQWSLTAKIFFFFSAPLRRRDFILFSLPPASSCSGWSPLLSCVSDILLKSLLFYCWYSLLIHYIFILSCFSSYIKVYCLLQWDIIFIAETLH